MTTAAQKLREIDEGDDSDEIAPAYEICTECGDCVYGLTCDCGHIPFNRRIGVNDN